MLLALIVMKVVRAASAQINPREHGPAINRQPPAVHRRRYGRWLSANRRRIMAQCLLIKYRLQVKGHMSSLYEWQTADVWVIRKFAACSEAYINQIFFASLRCGPPGHKVGVLSNR